MTKNFVLDPCNINCHKRYMEKDWHVTHAEVFAGWINRDHIHTHACATQNQRNFDHYLACLHNQTRVYVKPPYTNKDIEEDSEDEGSNIVDSYDEVTRRGHNPREPLFRTAW